MEILNVCPRSEAPLILLSSMEMIHLHNMISTQSLQPAEAAASNEVQSNAPSISRKAPSIIYLFSTALFYVCNNRVESHF
jgi:hypothetical protein